MSITETNKIDIVATRPGSSVVKLVITDHLDWDDLDTHAQLIQDKVNTYLEFVESGQLAQMKSPKIPEAATIQIALALQHPPSTDAEAFLARVREFLGGAGIGLDVEVRGSA